MDVNDEDTMSAALLDDFGDYGSSLDVDDIFDEGHPSYDDEDC